MERVERTVFISYRRTNAPWALAIYQNLTKHGFDVFYDFQGIGSGDFERVILGNINARAHFLVLLTPSALERCDSPDDWFRREIEAALRSRRNIVPLLLEGFDYNTPSIANQLIGELSVLKKYNAIRVPADYFDEAMNRVRERYLNIPLEAVLHPASRHAEEVARAQQAAAADAPEVGETALSAQEWFERGFNSKDAGEKMHYYSNAIRLKPDYGDAYNNRGNARRAKGDIDGALKDYDEAIRLQPDDHIKYNNRGIARRAKGDIDGALKDYDEAIRLKPDYGDAYNSRGNARQEKGDIDGALKDYDEAIRLKPDYGDTYNNRGIARSAKGDIDGALKDYDEAIRLQPDDHIKYNNRGLARKAKGDIDGALKDYDEAIRLKPDYGNAYNNRGIARKAKGDIDGALKDYDEAIRLQPDDHINYNNRGLARKAKGDIDGASKDFEKARHLEHQSSV